MSIAAGTRFGRYEIRSELGIGGMGEVYLAHDTQLDRAIALKVLPIDVASNQQRMRRFTQEARAAAALSHPNIAHIYEIGETAGTRFIAMEYVEGQTLYQHLQNSRMQLSHILDVAIQIASALAAAHAAGIIHRDIKPENIIVRHDGYIKVLDFGLAKLTEHQLTGVDVNAATQPLFRTEPGIVIGTVIYMSPEQARGLEVDVRTDVWSLGVVLYQMIAGRLPFEGGTPSDVIALILQKEPLPLVTYAPEASSELEQIVMKALAKGREERYQSALDLLVDLRRLKRRLDFEIERDTFTLTGDTTTHARGKSSQQTWDTSQPYPSAEQRKQVTVLFADVSGFTAMVDALDAEEINDMMKALWQRLDSLVTQHGGVIHKYMGDAMMALWGSEVTHEDDAERAIRAALMMQAEVSAFAAENLPPRPGSESDEQTNSRLMRIGINTGPVMLSTAGGKGDFTAIGSAVNVSSRLEQAAPVGSILISHDTYRHVRGVFEVHELKLTSAQGKAELIEAYVVERAKPRAFRLGTRGVEGVETRMIGRQAELERLLDSLQTVIEDRELHAMTVIGDAGLGKSRLLYEFRNEVELLPQLVRVFYGRASETMKGLPYSFIRDILSFRFEIQDSDQAAMACDKLEQGITASSGMSDAIIHAHFIGHLIGFDFSASPYLKGILDDAKQIRDRAFHYAVQFFTSVARDAPVILYLEDLHWADDGSLDFVDYLVRMCRSIPMLVLCLARPTLLERRPHWGEGVASHMRLGLQPLSKKESRQLVEEILRHAETIPQALRELVVSEAEGNPFYVEEMIKMLIDQKVIRPGSDSWRVDASRLIEVRVPPTLTGVLQARLDGLSAWEKMVLQRASVVGREFWDSAVEQLGTRNDQPQDNEVKGNVQETLERLRRKELIYRREISSFAGTNEYIFKHTLLRDVTYEGVLKRDRRWYHKAIADWLIEHSGERVNEYAGTIAEHLELAKESGRAADWYGRAAGQARESYAPEMAVGYYRKALEFFSLVTDRDSPCSALSAQRVEWYEGLGEVLWMQARYSEALEAYAAMLAVAEADKENVAQARAWNGLALVQGNQGDNHAMLESAKRAEAIARTADGSVQATTELASALIRQSWSFHRLGDAAAMMALGEQALSLSTELGEGARRERARSLQSLGVAYQMLGRFEQASSYIEQALALFRELGDRRLVANMLNSLGETTRLRGDYLVAFNRYREALTIAQEIGDRAEQMAYLGNLGAARTGMGDHKAAEADLHRVIQMAGAAGYFGLSENYRFLAEAFLGQGKVAEALGAAKRALELGEEKDNQEHIGGAWRVLGVVGMHTLKPITIGEQTYDAAACFARSLQVFTEMGAEAERARSLREWSCYERKSGDRKLGSAMWQEAYDCFSRLGMKLEVERMDASS